MSAVVRIPTSDDVDSNVTLQNYLRAHMQISNRLGYEYAVMAAELRLMLKDLDVMSGDKRRRYKVARPLAFAAATLALASTQLALTNKRFRELYAVELQATRRRQSTRRRMAFV